MICSPRSSRFFISSVEIAVFESFASSPVRLFPQTIKLLHLAMFLAYHSFILLFLVVFIIRVTSTLLSLPATKSFSSISSNSSFFFHRNYSYIWRFGIRAFILIFRKLVATINVLFFRLQFFSAALFSTIVVVPNPIRFADSIFNIDITYYSCGGSTCTCTS